MNPAQLTIEKVFGIAINPTQSYYLQLQEALGSSGDLSSKTRTNEILFELCQLVDKQAAQIKALENDRIEIANKMLELQHDKISPVDPTQPLDALSSPQTGGQNSGDAL